ncbi:MAG: hypothetical protein ABIE70_09515, partial [bacterium]
MRLKFAVIFAMLVFACYGLAMGDGVTIDHVDGLIDPTHVMTDSDITFHVRMSAPDNGHQGITNGFRVYSPDNPAVNWTTLHADTTGAIGKAQFDLLWLINYYSVTGMNSDTTGFAGSIFFGAGMPQGFDSITHTITIGPIASEFTGSTICLDSCYFPPSGLWKWAGVDMFPTWDGPHCYTIGGGTVEPPVITCPPDPFGFDLCGPEEIAISVPIDLADAVEVTGVPGAAWAGGLLTFTPGAADTYSMHITATNGDGTDECDVIAVVNFYDAVAIDCPTTPFEINLTEPGEVCVPLAVANYATVTPDMGGWTDGQLCFTAGAADTYTITVDATGTPSECAFTDQCVVTVIVSITELQPPVITCPTDPIDFTPCAQSGNLCFDLPVAFADEVTVDGAVWADNKVCFDHDGAATLNFHIVATNGDGTDECDVVVNVNPTPIVAIDCPTSDVPVTIGGPGDACVPLPITNNGTVVVSFGTGTPTFGTWADDVACIPVAAEGTYPVTVTASSTNPGCPADVCSFN